MSTTYEVSQQKNRLPWIVFPGQLVEVRQNCFEQKGCVGIIIDCIHPNFGIGYDDEYLVLVDGRITNIKTFMLYPLEISELRRIK